VIEPDDDDGHVVAAVLAVVTHRLRAAHVQDLKIKINFNFSFKNLKCILLLLYTDKNLGHSFNNIVVI
jgi:hypothetical protein